jgi:hypothetical protein
MITDEFKALSVSTRLLPGEANQFTEPFRNTPAHEEHKIKRTIENANAKRFSFTQGAFF